MRIMPVSFLLAQEAPVTLIARINKPADLRALEALPRGSERRVKAYDLLRVNAIETQREALANLRPLLNNQSISSIESMFLPNALLVHTTRDKEALVRDALQGVANIASVRKNNRFSLPDTSVFKSKTIVDPPVSWALDAINVAGARSAGAYGEGITIGIVDSGVDVTHPELKDAYRGKQQDGSQINDYNWLDGFGVYQEPKDPRGHGTSVASVAVGVNTGVAPKAKIIAARATADGYNDTVATLKSLQWMLAPTKLDGSSPDPKKGADIVNCSWGTSDGKDEFFKESYDGLKAAGVEMITATGNSGSEFGNVSAPASYPGFISVGASDKHKNVADFSSRGPSPVPHNTPDTSPTLVAPGIVVPTAKAGGGYVYSTGTSISTPVVSGVVALMMSANMSANHTSILGALSRSSLDIDAPGIDDSSGMGIVDAARAVQQIRG